jgi:hypothetical protein
MTKPTFPEWFCLNGGRKNFQIDPVRDQEYLFGEPEWEEDIDSRLRRAQLLGTPVRLVWWGQYGIGKTHRLRHTEYLINSRGYNYFPCYVVASDVQEKSGFERLHFELVNSLGKDRMRGMVSSFLLRLRTGQPGIPSLRDICGTSSDVVPALMSFGGDNDQLIMPAWRFLCGLKLKGNDLALANVTKDCLDSSTDFATVITALGTIIQLENSGKELIYLIDEGENLGKVNNRAAEARWQESIRSILDINNLGIVFTVGAERQEGIPSVILQPDIVRRFQRDNYIKMEAYNPPVAFKFMRGLLGNWIDASNRAALELSSGLAATVPDYDPALYPFTTGSFEKFCEWAVVDPRTAKPSEIIARLNNVAAEAYFKDRRLITRDHLSEMGIA